MHSVRKWLPNRKKKKRKKEDSEKITRQVKVRGKQKHKEVS
jgi:hypothetical protein